MSDLYTDELLDSPEVEVNGLVTLKMLMRNTMLVEARQAKGLNQAKAARQSGIPLYRFQDIEKLRRLPSDDEVEKIVAFFGKRADYFFPRVLLDAIESGVFERRDAVLQEPEIIRLTEAHHRELFYDGETALIEEVSRKELRENIDKALDTLTPRERTILELRFGLVEDHRCRTLEEVGMEFNVGRERIRQIEAKALRKLRHPSQSRMLKDYL